MAKLILPKPRRKFWKLIHKSYIASELNRTPRPCPNQVELKNLTKTAKKLTKLKETVVFEILWYTSTGVVVLRNKD